MDKAFLPEQMRRLFGVDGNLTKNIFFNMSAHGDGGKTTFLTNVAIVNAKLGKRVLQINHEQDRNEMLKTIEKGDSIVTAGGLHGTVVGTTDDTLTVEIAALKGERVRVKVARSKIDSRTKRGEDS